MGSINTTDLKLLKAAFTFLIALITLVVEVRALNAS